MMTSRVPAAVDALLAILRAAPGLADATVLDGPPVVNLTGLKHLFVGWQPSAEAAVSLTQQWNAAGARTRDEAFSINCYAEARAGDEDIQGRRTEVFALLGEVETALRASNSAPTAPTLNASVLWAELAAGDLSYDVSQGSLAGLAFTVTCQARI
jgi:hypothetical protein